MDTFEISPKQYKCSYCGSLVGSNTGYKASSGTCGIYICPICTRPTIIDHIGNRIPEIPFGEDVQGIDDQHVRNAYNEARNCTQAGAYTGAVLLCRKILMNIAVDKGAAPGKKFIEYIQFLVDNHYVPPDGEKWVDQIRDKGNEATHEIPKIERKDAEQIMRFTEMLLRFIYEMPSYLDADEEE
ncbi:DUF4145 domain-containing protein [Candidatus Latescibacterota bacterium]